MTMFSSSLPAGHLHGGGKALAAKRLLHACFLVLFFLCTASSCVANTASVKDLYMVGESRYQELQKDSEKQKLRSAWESTARAFEKAHAADPKDAWASASLFRAADTYLTLSKISGWKSDRNKAISLFQKVEKSYPKSFYKIQAGERLQELNVAASSGSSSKTPAKKTRATTRPDKTEKSPASTSSKEKPAPAEKGAASSSAQEKPASGKTSSKTNIIRTLRHTTHTGHTRIVVETDQESTYSYNDLKHDKQAGRPERIYIDFKNATLASSVKGFAIGDTQVKQVRIAQNAPDKVRLVIDVEKSEEFNIFQLYDPNRTIVDVMSTKDAAANKALIASLPDTVRQTKKPQTTKSAKSTKPESGTAVKTTDTSSIRKQLALGVNRIVIDPGHGGSDPGAVGYTKGVYEKNVNLQLARKLAEKLKNRLKCEVYLTRDRDVFLTLESRTKFANNKKADLFLSLHTNSSPSNKAFGIETYFLNLATDNESIAVAARENATSAKNISDLQTILNDLMRNAKINESSKLASYVQRGVITALKPHYKPLKDKGVKQAPFYVLLGAHMPSILIETGFINNQMECQRLTSAKYQDFVADGIARGVEAYIRDYMK